MSCTLNPPCGKVGVWSYRNRGEGEGTTLYCGACKVEMEHPCTLIWRNERFVLFDADGEEDRVIVLTKDEARALARHLTLAADDLVEVDEP